MNEALIGKLDTREFGGSGAELQDPQRRQPFSDDEPAMKWDGEWHITIEVFRDLGTAFAACLVILIYVLMVGWFRSFLTPLIVMMAIPFSLVGILPAHGHDGRFFTATSMIGFMAGAGIVVRNSIILVDFIEQLRACARHAAGRGRGRRRGGALPSDAAHRDGLSWSEPG
jgi:multidrug efflux pump subunit AcrB